MLKKYTATVTSPVNGRKFAFLVLGRTIVEAIASAESIYPCESLIVERDYAR